MIDWNMVEAIGTIFAASVALLFGLRDIISRRLNKPDIVLEHLHGKDYVICHEAKSEEFIKQGKAQDWCLFNLKIRNKGSITAKTVRVRIESIIQNKLNIIDFKNFNTHYLSMSFLQHEESVIFQLIRVDYIRNSIYLPRRQNISIEQKNFKITFLVTGDNFKAYRKSFDFIYSTDPKKLELREVKTVL